MGLARLAQLHGVATSYSPSPDVDVPVSDEAVVAVLAALGVDASTPAAVDEALTRAESAAARLLLPPTLVLWGAAAHPEPCGRRARAARGYDAGARPGARSGDRARRSPGAARRGYVAVPSARGAPADGRRPRRAHRSRRARGRPRDGAAAARPYPRLPGAALLPALQPLLGHGRPR